MLPAVIRMVVLMYVRFRLDSVEKSRHAKTSRNFLLSDSAGVTKLGAATFGCTGPASSGIISLVLDNIPPKSVKPEVEINSHAQLGKRRFCYK